MTGTPTRRQVGVFAAAGVAALGLGTWWQGRAAAAASPATAAPAGPLPGPLKTLDGRTLAPADLAQRSVVLNFWAPWCPPCIREMPELDRFARSPAAKETQVIGLAIDDEPAVRKFLGEHPVGFPIVVLGYAGLAWVARLGDDAKVLPFSAVYDRGHALVQKKVGPTTQAELSGWIARS